MGFLRSGKWYRGTGSAVDAFEAQYAKLIGAKRVLATANGTSALIATLGAMEIGPGDEVVISPYTFIATVNAVLMHHALPVFADTDADTFQVSAKSSESAMTDRTAALMPVHVAGSPADLDAFSAIAKRRKVRLIEDACQAHLGEWRGQKVGTVGDAGCFSFQASKNLNSGEGGAIVSNDEAFMERAYGFHTNGGGRRGSAFVHNGNGGNFRLTEFQATLLMSQMTRLEAQAKPRDESAARLTALFGEIPGIQPAKLHAGVTRSAWHLYMFRYDKNHFAGLSRAGFLKALAAEGVPCSAGYTPLNKQPFLENLLGSRHFKAIYSPARLKQWRERNELPANDQLCREAVWFTQTMLLAGPSAMDQIAEAIRKIQTHAGDLKAKLG